MTPAASIFKNIQRDVYEHNRHVNDAYRSVKLKYKLPLTIILQIDDMLSDWLDVEYEIDNDYYLHELPEIERGVIYLQNTLVKNPNIWTLRKIESILSRDGYYENSISNGVKAFESLVEKGVLKLKENNSNG